MITYDYIMYYDYNRTIFTTANKKALFIQKKKKSVYNNTIWVNSNLMCPIVKCIYF